jgi:hypothetical protein
LGYSKPSSPIDIRAPQGPLFLQTHRSIYVPQRGSIRLLFFHSQSLCNSTQEISSAFSRSLYRFEALSVLESCMLALKASLTSLSRRNGCSDRSTRCSSATTLLPLIVMVHHLANLSFALCLVRRGFDAVKRIRGLDQDRIINHDLRICPTGWKAEI